MIMIQIYINMKSNGLVLDRTKDEDKIPKHFFVEFWESMLTRNTKAYNVRLKWAKSPKKKKANSKAFCRGISGVNVEKKY